MSFVNVNEQIDDAGQLVDHCNDLPRGTLFLVCKQVFDVVICIALIPVLVMIGVGLLILNPIFNPGPLYFVQRRMGRNCTSFPAIKFRTMRNSPESARNVEAPVEQERITPLGRFLRRARIDELPQILNVLRGEMSLIGPRPDYFEHAVQYMAAIPSYGQRHSVRPGISGLAQTEVGYAVGVEATRRKVQADLDYIANRGFRMEAWIILRTFAVILGRSGE